MAANNPELEEVVRNLIDQEIGLEKFNEFDLTTKRKVQCTILVKQILREGHAQGIDAVAPAVNLCKQTELGAGSFLNNKMSTLLARALIGTGLRDADSSDVITAACEILLRELRRFDE